MLNDDLAAICSLNLKRNGSGSMAHLLEQQHILRREFNATPAAVNGGEQNGHQSTTAGGGNGGQMQQSQSNSSSLSPSIEQVSLKNKFRPKPGVHLGPGEMMCPLLGVDSKFGSPLPRGRVGDRRGPPRRRLVAISGCEAD